MIDANKYAQAKRILQEWKTSHHDEYCCFTDWMHDRDGSGFMEIFNNAIAFLPLFEKAIIRHIKDDKTDGITDIESMLKENGLESHLMKGLNTPHITGSTFMPMMAWLFFGRSFECMVEHGEELLRNQKQNFLMRIAIKNNIKFIVRQSISINARKEEDWIHFVDEQREMGVEPTVTGNVVSKFKSIGGDEKEKLRQSEKKRPAGRAVKRRSLTELIPNGDDYLYETIDDHVRIRNSGKDFAMLYIVLHEGQALARTNIVEFHAALTDRDRNKPEVSIPTPRSIQEGHKSLSEIVTIGGNRLRAFELPGYKEEFKEIWKKLSITDYRYSS